MINTVIHGDCKVKLKELEPDSVHSIVTDTPYELGFMGKSWDKTGIGFDVEMWKECYRVLKPGGYLLAFGGSRTYHRIASAIEDAGFEIRDQIMWIYGSGFPKSLNVGKAVDELQGNERLAFNNPLASKQTGQSAGKGLEGARKPNLVITKGQSAWEGWGTALKPAHEPIVVARKPLSEKNVALNVLKHGTGGINIDGCRVETSDDLAKNYNSIRKSDDEMGERGYKMGFRQGKDSIAHATQSTDLGRFPANIIHDGSDEVLELFPETKSGEMNSIAKGGNYNAYGKMYERKVVNHASSGSAARFFYCAKASKSERNLGCDKNDHPTVKPIALMRYLVRLVTPKDGICLDPFGGSGTTGIACILEDFNYILVEKEPDYCKIAEARIQSQLKLAI